MKRGKGKPALRPKKKQKKPPVSTGVCTTAPRVAGGRFAPGASGNPNGRPVGSRNKLGAAFVDVIFADFAKHGSAVIKGVREDEPAVYLRVVASLVPKVDPISDDGPLSGLSDGELDVLLGRLREMRVELSPEPPPRPEPPPAWPDIEHELYDRANGVGRKEGR